VTFTVVENIGIEYRMTVNCFDVRGVPQEFWDLEITIGFSN